MLRLTLFALLTTVVSACGHPAGTAAVPTAPKALANTLPEGPPLITPGEHMTFRLALQGLELAGYEIAVGESAEIAGKQTILVQAHAKSVGLANFAVKVDDYFSSWIDVATGRSQRWVTDEYASNGKDKERTEAQLHARSGDSVPMTFHLNDDPPINEPQKVSMPDVWDYNAFLIALRSWEGAPGSKVTVEVLRSRYLWHVEMTIRNREKLVTELGELPALRLDAHTYKLGRDGTKVKDSDERDFSVWISDDDGRVPLQVIAKTDYGDMKMSITDYQPGTGQRLRK